MAIELKNKVFMSILKFKEKLFKYLFETQCQKIKDTPPIQYRYREDLKIVTQVHHESVMMYLLAIKSFLYYFGSGSVYILDDGSLTDEDKELLTGHIPDIHIDHINNIDTGKCPKGGCWERLLYVIELSDDSYVIQLDADTLTFGPLVEIMDAVENNYGFVIGNPKWPMPVSVDFLSDIVSRWDLNHVQVIAEKSFYLLNFFGTNKKYIRGCAAFAGFPKNKVSKDVLERFSIELSKVIGNDKWNEWGSEQVASNVLLGGCSDSIILPWPRYQNYKFPQVYKNAFYSAALIHFIGSNRFSDRFYEKNIRGFINQIMG